MLTRRSLVDVAADLVYGRRPLRAPEWTDGEGSLEIVEVHVLHALRAVPRVVRSSAPVLGRLEVADVEVEGQRVGAQSTFHGIEVGTLVKV